jgi:hypothetical protein
MPQMAKDDTQKAATEAPVTREELLALVQTLVAAGQMTSDKVREIATAVTVDV